MDYDELSIRFEPARGDVRGTYAQSSSGGTARGTFALPVRPEEMGQQLRDLGAGVLSRPATAFQVGRHPKRTLTPASRPRLTLQKFGGRLFDALFSGPVRALFDQSWGRAESAAERGLRIRLHFDLDDRDLVLLSSLPWEFLYWQERREFLSLSRYTPVVRQISVPQPTRPLHFEPPLRILVAMGPAAGISLDLDEERRGIEEAWGRHSQIEAVFLEHVTLPDLRRWLAREPFHVLHFMGHGDFFRDTGAGVLTFGSPSGSEAPITGRSLAAVLHDRRQLRLVFLNACDSARASTGEGDSFAGVATALVKAGLPAVLAMQFPVSDAAGIVFSSAFYDQFVRGRDLHTATAEGRQAILAGDVESQEWGTPVLFERVEPAEASVFGSSRRAESRPHECSSSGSPGEHRARISILRTKLFWLTLMLFAIGFAALVAYETYLNRPPGEYQIDVNVLTEEGFPTREALLEASPGEALRAGDGWLVKVPRLSGRQEVLLTAYLEAEPLRAKAVIDLRTLDRGTYSLKLSRYKVRIRGTVVDPENRPVPGAMVSIDGLEAVMSNENGFFEIEDTRRIFGVLIQLLVTKEGFTSREQAHPAGDKPVTLEITRKEGRP